MISSETGVSIETISGSAEMAQTAIGKHAPPLTEEQIEVTNKNIDLAFEFIRNEETRLEPPNGSTLLLLPEDDPKQTAANIKLGLKAIERGENVYFRHVHRQPKNSDASSQSWGISKSLAE